MTIRAGSHRDIDALVAMGATFLGSVYAGKIPVNVDVLTALATHLIADPASAVFVAEDGDGLTGMIGMMVYTHPMSGERTASEVMWWAARGAGLRLFRAGERWAVDQGAVVLQMIAPTADVATLYDRLGFEAVETIYQRRLDRRVHAAA